MQISDVVFKSLHEIDEMHRFDLEALPLKTKWYLQLLTWILSFPELIAVRPAIRKHGMENVKEPYILLCNHNSFLDFKVAVKAVFPRRANFIVAIDGFINREVLMRKSGCFGKRKFVSDPAVFRQVKHSLLVNKVICEIYPEARYSLVGTSSVLPDSLGKMIKNLGRPVVTLISHGHHLRQPVWNLKKRRVKTSSDMTLLFDRDQIDDSSIDEINSRLKEAFRYDDYQYQADNGIRIKYRNRAAFLHKPLYQCPYCLSEFEMKSKRDEIWCENCGVVHRMDDLGRLTALNAETKFSHIPDWFEWQRTQVRKEVASGKYHIEMEVDVDLLPNSSGYYRLGRGLVVHNFDGFHLTGNFGGEILDVTIPVSLNYGLHIEYEYFGKGDCFSFSSRNDTYYLYPAGKKQSVTKLHFGTEELYRNYRSGIGTQSS